MQDNVFIFRRIALLISGLKSCGIREGGFLLKPLWDTFALLLIGKTSLFSTAQLFCRL
jgi:hypothetical protein